MSATREGDIDVPGGRLRFRQSGSAEAPHTIVLENGWSGSFPYMSWLAQALAPHARVIAYDRAGIGYSQGDSPPTSAGMTQHLAALLAALGVSSPVAVIGHSYGGLIGVLHKVQAPQRVSHVIQVDPTPEFEDELIEASLRVVPKLARVMQLLAVLKLDRALMPELRALPPEMFSRLHPSTTWVLRSLNGARAEISLLAEIRRTIISSEISRQCPRLVISAAPPVRTPGSWFGRLMAKPEQEAKFRAASHALHRRQASLNSASRWTTLPYSHVGLIVDPDSAAQVATATLDFLRKNPHGA